MMTMRPPGVREILIAALFWNAACGSEPAVAPDGCPAPEILSARVAANPSNVLSAVVTARVRAADSVSVSFGARASALDATAPAVVPRGDSVQVTVLGLMPNAALDLRVKAYGPCGETESALLSLTTDPLPEDLPSYSAGGSAPAEGFVVFAAGTYGIAIDNTGRIVWYHRFANGPGLNFQAQANGRYVARPPSGAQGGGWLELDPLGTITRVLGCAHGLSPRFHDLIVNPDGSYWVMCDETRTMDLLGLGGRVDAKVTGTVIQRIGVDGSPLFEWSPFDHLSITDLAASERRGATVNWTHGNALDLDREGNLLVSFRNLNEITKIDTRTGAVIWRMGGLANQFAFADCPALPFFGQHGIRVADGGSLLLLDNLGEVLGSRAERYEIDEGQRTARLVGAFSPDVSVTAQVGGTTQPLPSGHALISFGSGGRVEEFDGAGNSVWRIQGQPGYIFRAQRIRSLYSPGLGTPR